MKEKYYNPWPTDEERLMHKPPFVSSVDWRWLVRFWSLEEAQVSTELKILLLFIDCARLNIIHIMYFYYVHVISKRNKNKKSIIP